MRPLIWLLQLLGVAPLVIVASERFAGLSLPFVRFDRPIATLPCAIAIWFIASRLGQLSRRLHPLRRAMVQVIFGIAALAAALSVIGVELGRPLDRLAILVAIDRSRSIDLVPNASSRIAEELRVAELGMREHDRIGTIAFAAEATVEDPLRPRSQLPAPQKAEVGRDGTDIGRAIRRSLAEVPPDAAARIVLLSDGVSTRGDALEDAAAAVAAGVPVDVVPLDQTKLKDVRLVGVRMPSRATEGEALDMRVVTSASEPSDVEIRVYRDGELVRKGNAKLGAGEDVLHLRELAPVPGFHRYDVELSASDPNLDGAREDNSGSAFVRVRGQSRALVLETDPALAAPMAHALEVAAFNVDTKGPSGVPADVAAFAVYDLIVLSDIAASDLATTQLDALASYVRDLGGGVLLMGGDRSMGPGGYGKTPIEDVSPVSFDLKQERRRASLAEVIAVDYSGSMAAQSGKHTKLELANEAAVRSAELLGTGDRLGVMHVDTIVKWTVPLAPVADKASIAKRIRAVAVGGGGIYVDITLEAAYAALEKEKVQLKHLLLFADGSDAEERAQAFMLVNTAKSRGITTSVVALGRGSDVAALEHMSKLGNGRFYLIEDASRLPAVFAQETILAARASINEVAFRPALGSPGAPTRGIDFANAPPLTGYVVTIPKGRAAVHLAGPEGDPILATWSVGIGRSAAFTSDYKDRWGAAWTHWEGAARLFGQVARDISRRADNPRVRIEADTLGGDLRVRASVVDERGRAENFRRLAVRVAGPDGFSQIVPLEATGAGTYGARIALSRPGAFVTTAVDEVTGEALGTAGAVLSAGEEMRPTGTDRALLTRVAELSDGKVRDTLAGIFNDRSARRFAYESLTRLFLLFAAFGLLFGVAARRLSLPDWLAALPTRVRRELSVRRMERTSQTTEPLEASGHAPAKPTLGSLLEAKARSVKAATPVVVTPSGEATARDEAPPSVPHFSHPAPHHANGAAPENQSQIPAHSNERKLSAAEILLARRKGKPRH